MSDFQDLQKEYRIAKSEWDNVRKAQYLAQQQKLIIESQIAIALKQTVVAELPVDHPLSKRIKDVDEQLNQATDRLATAQNDLVLRRKAIDDFGEVNKVISELDDETPFLLLPLRLQTRFRISKYIALSCPPELAVDASKQSMFSAIRLRSLVPHIARGSDQLNSGGMHAAALLSNIGTANALGFISDLNQGGVKRWRKKEDVYELLVRIFPDDIFFQTHEAALTEEEINSAKSFWTETWLSEKDFRDKKSLPGSDVAILEKQKDERQLQAWKIMQTSNSSGRAAWAARMMRPSNFDSTDFSSSSIPEFPAPDLKSDSWTIAPYSELLPDCFTVRLIFNNEEVKEVRGNYISPVIQLGFDPNEPDDNSFEETGDTLRLPLSIRWLTDFDEAEKTGMAVRIPLTQIQYSVGIRNVIALGIKTSADKNESRSLLEKLFDNHHYRPQGMAFLPQGTPTNNLPGNPSGFNPAALDPELVFRTEIKQPPVIPEGIADGARFAGAIGINPSVFSHIHNCNQLDAEEALAFNRAFYPGTIGYYLENLMRPFINDSDIACARQFFTDFVTGRGLLPAFRIGKQPYGIVPTTNFSAWKSDADETAEKKKLVSFLLKWDKKWLELSAKVKTVKSIFDPASGNSVEQQNQEFRELLSYQASSTRFFRRLVAGEYFLWNFPAGKPGIKTTPAEFQSILRNNLLWGKLIANHPPLILSKFLDDENYKLTDFLPNSAAGPNLRTPDNKNYLQLLLDATSENLRLNSYGDDFASFLKHLSSKLTFHLARFAILQGDLAAAVALLRIEKSNISKFSALDFELEYLEADNKKLSQEHLDLLTKALGIKDFSTIETRKDKWTFFNERMNNGKSLIEELSERIKTSDLSGEIPEIRQAASQRRALSSLAALPDVQLERLLTEHLDLCSHRLDAWLQGLVLERLKLQREKQTDPGIFLGAYGYVENLKPSTDTWISVQEIASPEVVAAGSLPPGEYVMPVFDFADLTSESRAALTASSFVYLGSDPKVNLIWDSSTQKVIQNMSEGGQPGNGFLLTPSLEHATTAAILRSGYDHHANDTSSASKTLAVNLNSERMGQALDLLKGVQAGHTLNEQLGYFIERLMYEYETPLLSQYVLDLRKQFPLAIEKGELERDQSGDGIKTINLSMVSDGLKILTAKKAANAEWNNFLVKTFGAASVYIEFLKIIDKTEALFDSVSDLLLAESVYQTVKGSPEKAAAALRITGEGANIILPEITKIPVPSQSVSHRIAFVLNSPANSQAWTTEEKKDALISLAAQFSPDLNRWISDQLPDPKLIVAKVTAGDNDIHWISLAEIGLQAIDFYLLLKKSGGKAEETLLAHFFGEKVREVQNLSPELQLQVSFQKDEDFPKGKFSIKELVTVIECISAMLSQSRVMQPSDWIMNSDSSLTTFDANYDNKKLKAVVRKYSGTKENFPIPAFLKKLTQSISDLKTHLTEVITPETQDSFGRLFDLLPTAYFFGVWDAMPRSLKVCDSLNINLLLEQAESVSKVLNARAQKASTVLSAISDGKKGQSEFETLLEIAKIFCGEDFLVLPRFTIPNQKEIEAAYHDTHLLPDTPFVSEEWLQSVAMVRENPRNYQFFASLREAVGAKAASRDIRLLQVPYQPGTVNYCVGGAFPKEFKPPLGAVSLAFEFSANFSAEQKLSGILLDEWREKIPEQDLPAGVTINYNQPDNEAPQVLLLAVTPERMGAWQWESLFSTILETMELARKRAVTAELFQSSYLNQFLPALIAPFDTENNIPGMNYAVAGPQGFKRPTDFQIGGDAILRQ